ncbi:hypothetical protein [Pseudonocardia sp. ICBG1293]|uniref:hypothetical protein n=1 Tax=Pseudonocardia sp. ICBG1293 TaxID=2844382 RepID=UPI001CCBE8EB|nr:hypothetical protein [Pseudonocardia sp. ICBG1293]
MLDRAARHRSGTAPAGSRGTPAAVPVAAVTLSRRVNSLSPEVKSARTIGSTLAEGRTPERASA